MDTLVKQEWITALRSGEYMQGTDALNKNDYYCCLGVLCDLAVKRGVPISVHSYAEEEFEYVEYDEEIQILPNSIVEWAKLDDNNPVIQFYEGPGRYDSLAELNDAGFTFVQIADVINYFL